MVFVDLRALRNDRVTLVEKGSPHSLCLMESGKVVTSNKMNFIFLTSLEVHVWTPIMGHMQSTGSRFMWPIVFILQFIYIYIILGTFPLMIVSLSLQSTILYTDEGINPKLVCENSFLNCAEFFFQYWSLHKIKTSNSASKNTFRLSWGGGKPCSQEIPCEITSTWQVTVKPFIHITWLYIFHHSIFLQSCH